MRCVLASTMLALFAAAGCRAGDAPPAGTSCCPGRPPAPVAAAEPPTAPPAEGGFVIPIGSTRKVESADLGRDVYLEIGPLEALPAVPGGAWPGVRCTVRLRRADGSDLGPARVFVRSPRGSRSGSSGTWILEPAPGWTGTLPGGETLALQFAPVEGMPRAPYGWFVDLSATPADEGHVRFIVEGSVPI